MVTFAERAELREPRPSRGKGKGIAFLNAAFEANSDACFLWPFSKGKSGYGYVGTFKGSFLAHRYACEMANGPPPFAGAQAMHRCGQRGCVNPRHLRWGTQQENEADKIAHGTWLTRMGGAKLTSETVKAIRAAAASGVHQDDISKVFGVPRSTVRKVVRRYTWKHVLP